MRIVAKIGTSSLTGEHGVINRAAIAKLSDEVVEVRAAGNEVLVISSGAVAAGVAALGLMTRPTDMATLQALAAAGQSRLMEVWNAELGRHGVVAAQALLDPHDFVNRKQYLHTRQTLVRLLELGCVPVINENDAIANDDDRYGDNDRLAALTAHNVGADMLVLLTDLDGLYTSDPRVDADAQLVRHIGSDDPLLAIRAGVGGSGRGSGGMAGKLAAARIASWSGVRTVIARASGERALVAAVSGDVVGTVFEAHTRRLPARKLWIAFASRVAGAVVVDDGARRALTERTTSLLPAGVTDVVGPFGEGDIIDVRGSDGAVFARGMVFVDSSELRRAAGKHTRDLPEGMVHEVIHRDDLVLLPA